MNPRKSADEILRKVEQDKRYSTTSTSPSSKIKTSVVQFVNIEKVTKLGSGVPGDWNIYLPNDVTVTLDISSEISGRPDMSALEYNVPGQKVSIVYIPKEVGREIEKKLRKMY